MLTLRFDGLFHEIESENRSSCRIGFLCYGWLLLRDGRVIARGHGAVTRGRDANSNCAEYLGLIEGLDALLDLDLRQEPVRICGDNKGVIEQMQGRAGVNSPSLKSLYQRALRLARRFHKLIWTWLPRKDNRAADHLTRRAMRQLVADPQVYEAAVQTVLPNGSRNGSRRLVPVLDLRVYNLQGG